MDVTILRTFVEVARMESYAGAARNLHLSQPGAYQQVRRLEMLMGGRLVEQHGKSVRLTSLGKIALPKAVKMVEEEKVLTSLVEEVRGNHVGRVELLVGSTIGESVLPPLLVNYRRKYPGIELQIDVMSRVTEMDDGVLRFGYDFALHSGGTPRLGLEKTPVVDDELVFVHGQDFARVPRSRRGAVTPSDVAASPIIVSRPGARLRELVEGWLSGGAEDARIELEMDSQQAMVAAVRGGDGAAIVSRMVAQPFAAAGMMEMRPLAPPLRRQFYVVRRTGATLSVPAATLVADLQDLGRDAARQQARGRGHRA